MSNFFKRFYDESGLSILLASPRDVHLIILQRCSRMALFGATSIVLTALFQELNFSDFYMGLFMTLTMLGDAGGSLVLTLFADRLGRTKVLLAGSVLMIGSGLVFSLFSNYFILLLAATVGVITPSGGEIGPFRAIEESILAQLTVPEERATIFAWYSTISIGFLAFGTLAGGWITHGLQTAFEWTSLGSYRLIFVFYSCAGIFNCLVTSMLSQQVEVVKKTIATQSEEEEGLVEMVEEEVLEEKSKILGLSPETKGKVWKLSGLLGLDSLSGGLVPVTFIVYFFTIKFKIDEGTLGNTFFTTSIVAALSSIVAASLARKFGNIKTMAFTHLPSAILLALVPLPPNFQGARAVLVAVFCTTKMDIGPRTAFLTSYVNAEERTAVMGIISVVRMIASSVGPTFTGWLSNHELMWVSFVVAGVLQAIYDVAMLVFFASVQIVS